MEKAEYTRAPTPTDTENENPDALSTVSSDEIMDTENPDAQSADDELTDTESPDAQRVDVQNKMITDAITVNNENDMDLSDDGSLFEEICSMKVKTRAPFFRTPRTQSFKAHPHSKDSDVKRTRPSGHPSVRGRRGRRGRGRGGRGGRIARPLEQVKLPERHVLYPKGDPRNNNPEAILRCELCEADEDSDSETSLKLFLNYKCLTDHTKAFHQQSDSIDDNDFAG